MDSCSRRSLYCNPLKNPRKPLSPSHGTRTKRGSATCGSREAAKSLWFDQLLCTLALAGDQNQNSCQDGLSEATL